MAGSTALASANKLTSDELQRLIAEKKDLDLKAFLGAVEKASDEKEVKDEPSTRRARVLAFAESLKEAPQAQIDRVHELMTEFTSKHLKVMPGDEPRELTQDEINSLSLEYAVYIQISEAMAAIFHRYRVLTNGHLDTVNADSEKLTDRPPRQVKGKLVPNVEGAEWTFCREGGDRTNPTVLWDVLKRELPAEVYGKITDTVKVPRQVTKATTRQDPNSDKLMAAVYDGTIPLEVLRTALVPGRWQTPKFQPRRKRR